MAELINTQNTSFEYEVYKIEKLGKDVKSELLNGTIPTRSEVKTIVKLFYQVQDQRKILREQLRSIENNNKDSSAIALEYLFNNTVIMENSIKNILQTVADSSAEGLWLQQIVGIGPILTAGLLAHFDIDGKQYASQFISYAGLNDNNRPFIGKVGAEAIMKEIKPRGKISDEDAAVFAAKTQWNIEYLRQKAYDQEKGTWNRQDLIKAAAKIPYNKDLKVLMFKVGQSFVWMSGKDKSLYGKLYLERKAQEIANNEAGLYADQAAHILATKNIKKSTDAYKAYVIGKLPNAHIQARSIRWVEKIFICHLFEEMYRERFKKKPPRYWPFAHMDGRHNKEIAPEVPYTWYDPSEV